MTSYAMTRPAPQLPRVLLVDDEVAILDGLRRQLRRSFSISTAAGGTAALETIQEEGPFAAIVSDMRMPGMDGAALLAEVRERAPDTTRLLLTGQADTESAIAAINEGQIFRFLTKPCPADALMSALVEAVELNRLVTAERDVLERTLRGAVESLVEVLSLANPKAFSRAVRVSQLVTAIAEQIGAQTDWQLEVAGMLAQIGTVTLPTAVLDKMDEGVALADDEVEMVAAVPKVSEQLLAHIPRMDGVAAAIGQQRLRYDGADRRIHDPVGGDIPLVARILRLAVDFDALRGQHVPALTAIARLRKDSGAYDPDMLDAWERCHSAGSAAADVPIIVDFEDLQPGMVLIEDILSGKGVVLIGRGSTVTDALLQRLRNHVGQSGLSGSIVVSSELTHPGAGQQAG